MSDHSSSDPSERPATQQARADLIDRVQSMSREEIDALPVGVMTLDLDGMILEYNETEAVHARRTAAKQIGRNFFRDVAPCTASPEFEGRFRELAEPGASGKADFEYEFVFPWAREKVVITFLRAQGGMSIYVLVTWPIDLAVVGA